MNCTSSEPLLSHLSSSSTTQPPSLHVWIISPLLFLNHPSQGRSEPLRLQMCYFLHLEHRNFHGLRPPPFRPLLRCHFTKSPFLLEQHWLSFLSLSLFLAPLPPPTCLFVFFGTHNNMTYYAYLFVYCVPSTLECEHHSMTAGTWVTFVLCRVPRESGIC